jgi:hypothetical protein
VAVSLALIRNSAFVEDPVPVLKMEEMRENKREYLYRSSDVVRQQTLLSERAASMNPRDLYARFRG